MFYLYLLAFIVVGFYLITIKKRRRRRKILNKLKVENNNQGQVVNILNGITKGKKLYKELASKIHPDRYQEYYKEEATRLNQELTLNKKNFEGMILIKDQIERLHEQNQNYHE
ncbi:MAG: hypothetical protein RL207_2009 [Bacteroidota bacterium]|jgi:nitrogen regulatory protein PII-like uncharacterized protein